MHKNKLVGPMEPGASVLAMYGFCVIACCEWRSCWGSRWLKKYAYIDWHEIRL